MRTFASCFLLLQAHAARARACLIIIIIIIIVIIIILLLLLLLACPVLNKQQPIVLVAVFCISLRHTDDTAQPDAAQHRMRKMLLNQPDV
jgi:flagellar basal body-associated protein FliL